MNRFEHGHVLILCGMASVMYYVYGGLLLKEEYTELMYWRV